MKKWITTIPIVIIGLLYFCLFAQADTVNLIYGNQTDVGTYITITDWSRDTLVDGDVVQLIYSVDATIDDPNATTGLPTGDDVLWEYSSIGSGVGPANTGQFLDLCQYTSGNLGYYAYVRFFDNTALASSVRYGNSSLHTLAESAGIDIFDITDAGTKELYTQYQIDASPTLTPATPTPTVTPTVTPTTTPSVTPTIAPTASPQTTLTPAVSATPTPFCTGADPYYAWDITTAAITTTRASTGFAMQYNIVRVSDDTSFGTIYDTNNGWIDGDDSNYGAVALKISGTQVEVHDGDSLQITSGGATLFVFMPNVYSTDILYVSDDGSTYYDATLCTIAKSATGAKSPTPTPIASPTPVQTDCLTLISYPYTADETSIYDLLNLDFAAIVDAQNEHCFRSPIGQVDIAPNAIGNEELRDYAVHTEEILNNTILGGSDGDIAGSTITSFNINTNSFDYSDVFPKANEIVIPYNNASGVSSPQWEVMCMPYWNNLSGSFSINYNTTTSDRERIIFIDKDTLWMSVGGEIPTATLDVNGPMRVRGSLTLDRGLVQQWVAFDAGDATPFVRDGTRFYTANTAANPGTISNFDGAESGHEFYLWVNDTDTTWAATTGNINFTTATTSSEDELYKFLRMGDKWYEVGHWDYGPITGSGSPSDVYAFEGFESDSFSGGDGDWSGPWVISGNTTTSSRYAHTGTYSSAVYYDGASLYRGINTSSGTVTLSMWIYAHYGSPTLHIYDSVNTTTWNELTSKAFTGAWQEWSYTWTMADKQPEYIKFAVTSVNDAVVRLYLDDITIE